LQLERQSLRLSRNLNQLARGPGPRARAPRVHHAARRRSRAARAAADGTSRRRAWSGRASGSRAAAQPKSAWPIDF